VNPNQIPNNKMEVDDKQTLNANDINWDIATSKRVKT
jgi:hypothetical protein